MVKAVFLDRDGTIVEDTDHLHERNKVRFLPQVAAAIKLLNKNGFKVVVVTNQAGVARGYFTEEVVRDINDYIRQLLSQEDAFIDKIYYCPHHPEGIIPEYRRECNCRKPNPGMLRQSAEELNINLNKSFLIGDKMSDIEAGRGAGCKTILLLDNKLPGQQVKIPPASDHIATNLYEAVEWIIAQTNQS